MLNSIGRDEEAMSDDKADSSDNSVLETAVIDLTASSGNLPAAGHAGFDQPQPSCAPDAGRTKGSRSTARSKAHSPIPKRSRMDR